MQLYSERDLKNNIGTIGVLYHHSAFITALTDVYVSDSTVFIRHGAPHMMSLSYLARAFMWSHTHMMAITKPFKATDL